MIKNTQDLLSKLNKKAKPIRQKCNKNEMIICAKIMKLLMQTGTGKNNRRFKMKY